MIFNKKSTIKAWEKSEKPSWMYVCLTIWVDESKMSDKEKEAYPSYVTTGGYLKCYSSLKEAYVESWEKSSKEDKELTFKLPNFDIDVFKEVFGFTPVIDDRKKIVIDGKEIMISKEIFESLREQLVK